MGEQGWDADVKKYFRKIINTISFGLLWLMATATAGLYFQLAWKGEKPLIYTVLFYVLAVATLLLLLRYFYKLWSK